MPDRTTSSRQRNDRRQQHDHGEGRRRISILKQQDRPLDEGRWAHLEAGPVTAARPEEPFERAHAIIDHFARSGQVSMLDGCRLMDALNELTEFGRCYPAQWWDLRRATSATTCADALDDATQALTELIRTSTHLPTTLAVLRARAMVDEVRNGLPADPGQPQLPLGDHADHTDHTDHTDHADHADHTDVADGGDGGSRTCYRAGESFAEWVRRRGPHRGPAGGAKQDGEQDGEQGGDA